MLSAIKAGVTRVGDDPKAFRAAVLCFTALNAVLCGLASIHMGVDAGWDLLNYHLYTAFALFNDRSGLDILPAQVQTFFNPVLDIPFYALIQVANDYPRLICFVMGSLHGFNVTLSFLIAWEALKAGALPARQRGLYAALATVIGITGAGSVSLIGTTSGDLPAATFVLLSLWLFLVGARRLKGREAGAAPGSRWAAAILSAGFLSGLAAGLKLTAAIYSVGLAAALLCLPPRRLLPAAAAFGLAGAAGLLAGGGYQFVHLYRLFGNPVFPMFNGIFHSPGYAAANVFDDRFLPRTTLEAIFRPFLWVAKNAGVVSEVYFKDPRFALLWILLAALAVSWIAGRVRRDGGQGRLPAGPFAVLLVFSLVSYVVWQRLFSIYRYLVPLELISGALLVVGILRLTSSAAARRLLVGLVLVLTLGLTGYMSWGRVPISGRYISVSHAPLPADALVVIATFEHPVSFIIPFFPHSVSWIRIDDGYPDLAREGVARIRRHRGPRYVLQVAGDRPAERAELLRKLGLSPKGGCDPVAANIAFLALELCPVESASP